METVNLIRTESGDEGTFGIILAKDKKFFTGEPPERDNLVNFSCIPTGEYLCKITQSPHFGAVYKVHDVEGRTDILIHWGNWCGDKKKGYITDTGGCIIVGKERKIIKGQKAVSSSSYALNKFMVLLDNKPFKLVVSGIDIW